MVLNPKRHYQNDNVAATYDQSRFSSLAGKTFDALEKYNIRKAFKTLPKNSTILDVPCGTGRLAETLLESGFQVVGMDISEAMLAQAKRKLERFGDRFTCQTADLLSPDFSWNRHYDAALCARVLMHFPFEEQVLFLRNVASIVKGQIVFTQSWTSNYQTFRRSVKRMLRHQPSVNYPISKADKKRLLEGAGLCELRNLRPCSPITEEIIVITEKL